MDAIALHQFLALYSWFPWVAILAFMLLIARFYQRFSGQRTYFWLFIAPMILSGIYAVRYASQERISGDALLTLFSVLGGVLLLLLVLNLQHRMLKHGPPTDEP